MSHRAPRGVPRRIQTFSGDAAFAVQGVVRLDPPSIAARRRSSACAGNMYEPASRRCSDARPRLHNGAGALRLREARVFLQSPEAARCCWCLGHSLTGGVRHRLSGLRADRGSKPRREDLKLEEDVGLLLKTHEALANCVLNDPERRAAPVGRCARRIAVRTNSWPCWPTNSATRWRRSATPSRFSCGAEATRERSDRQPNMNRQVGHMVRLVDDLLDVSRISRGKIELRKERIELASVVNHAVEAARPHCESMGHELTVTLPPEAGVRVRRPDPAGSGRGQPSEQRLQVHRQGRSHSPHRRARRRAGGRPSAGHAASASPPTSFPASSRCSCRSIRRWSVHETGWASV